MLRDTTENRPYSVRVDDQLGQLRVSEIRATEVIFTIEDFGVERQVSLMLRRPRRQGSFE